MKDLDSMTIEEIRNELIMISRYKTMILIIAMILTAGFYFKILFSKASFIDFLETFLFYGLVFYNFKQEKKLRVYSRKHGIYL